MRLRVRPEQVKCLKVIRDEGDFVFEHDRAVVSCYDGHVHVHEDWLAMDEGKEITDQVELVIEIEDSRASVL